MIVVGYQGIGKSSMAKNNADVIDLESGNFWVDGKRIDDWYKIYANIAKHLSDQGKIVFTSSHKVFRDYLNEKGIEFTVVFPDHSIKDKWIEKLQERYDLTKLEKDYKALMNAKQMYDENISDLEQEKNIIKIVDPDYLLSDIVEHLIDQYSHLNKHN